MGRGCGGWGEMMVAVCDEVGNGGRRGGEESVAHGYDPDII